MIEALWKWLGFSAPAALYSNHLVCIRDRQRQLRVRFMWPAVCIFDYNAIERHVLHRLRAIAQQHTGSERRLLDIHVLQQQVFELDAALSRAMGREEG